MLIGLVTLALPGTALMAMNPGNPDPTQNSWCHPRENMDCIENCDYNYMCQTTSYCNNSVTAPVCYLAAETTWFACNLSCAW